MPEAGPEKSDCVRQLRIAGTAGALEVLHEPARGRRAGPTSPGGGVAARPGGSCPALVFVHGAYVGAWVWAEHFLGWFARRGFDAYALSLRGHGASAGASSLDRSTLADYVDDLDAVIDAIGGPTVLVGHSMGGMVVQRYLLRREAHAAVLMAPVPPWGLGPACAELAWRKPSLLVESTLAPHAGPAGGGEALAAALFSAALGDRRWQLLARAGGESRRALLDMLGLDLPWRFGPPGTPLLVLGADRDGFFAPHAIRATALAYGAPVEIFPDMAHAMMLEPGWEAVAGAIARWAPLDGRP